MFPRAPRTYLTGRTAPCGHALDPTTACGLNDPESLVDHQKLNPKGGRLDVSPPQVEELLKQPVEGKHPLPSHTVKQGLTASPLDVCDDSASARAEELLKQPAHTTSRAPKFSPDRPFTLVQARKPRRRHGRGTIVLDHPKSRLLRPGAEMEEHHLASGSLVDGIMEPSLVPHVKVHARDLRRAQARHQPRVAAAPSREALRQTRYLNSCTRSNTTDIDMQIFIAGLPSRNAPATSKLVDAHSSNTVAWFPATA